MYKTKFLKFMYLIRRSALFASEGYWNYESMIILIAKLAEVLTGFQPICMKFRISKNNNPWLYFSVTDLVYSYKYDKYSKIFQLNKWM